MLRTSRLLIKASAAEPCISLLLHQGHRSSYPNHFGSSSQHSDSSSCWSCSILASVLCKKSWCKPALGAQLQHSPTPTDTPRSIPWWHLSCGDTSLFPESVGLPEISAWLHLQLALENLSLQHSQVSSMLTHERAGFFNPAPSFLPLHKVLAALISSLCTMGAITNRAVMFSIAYLTLYAQCVNARAFIFSSAAWKMHARGTSLVKEPIQSHAFFTAILKISAQTNCCPSDRAMLQK